MRRASSAKRSPTSSVLARTWRTICSHLACIAGSAAVMTSFFAEAEAGAGVAGATAPRLMRGADRRLAMRVSPQIGHSTRPRASWPWNSSSEPNQPSNTWCCVHSRSRTFMEPSLWLPVEFPRSRKDVLQPHGAGEGLGIGDRAVAAPVDHLLRSGGEHFEELLVVEFRFGQLEPAAEPDVDELGGIR